MSNQEKDAGAGPMRSYEGLNEEELSKVTGGADITECKPQAAKAILRVAPDNDCWYGLLDNASLPLKCGNCPYMTAANGIYTCGKP